MQGDFRAYQWLKSNGYSAAPNIEKEELIMAYLTMRAEGHKDKENEIYARWCKSVLDGSLTLNIEPDYSCLRLFPDPNQITQLPEFSCLLKIPFKLKKAYISRDENDFHILDNPLRCEKIFRNPLVASTSWKGALRSALWHLGKKDDDEQIIRMFGNPRQSEDSLAGRIHFYSSFFDRNQVSLEVINPHERRTGVGIRPIRIESVKPGATADLICLYVPFGYTKDSGSSYLNAVHVRQQIAQDLILMAQGLVAMLTVYGFGAKTSSGFGVVEDRLHSTGLVALRYSSTMINDGEAPKLSDKTQAAALPRYLESPTRLHADFLTQQGELKSEEEYRRLIIKRGQKYSKSNHQLYEKARKWWEQQHDALSKPLDPKTSSEEINIPQPILRREFTRLSELVQVVYEVTQSIQKGEDV